MPFDSDSIYERDGWVCTLCGVSLATTVGTSHILAPTVDHIFPQARGGSDEASNLQAAHRRCNSAKGASESYDATSAGSGPLHMTETASGDLMFDILAALRDQNPEIAKQLDRLMDDGEPLVEVSIPTLAPERVGPIHDEAMCIAVAYAEGIAASDEVPEIVEESLEELGDAEDTHDTVTQDLLEVAVERMANTLQEELPEVAGLAPIWGLRPFNGREWVVLAQIFLDYGGAYNTIGESVESALIETGEDSEYVLELRSYRLREDASRLTKAGRLQEADESWQAVMDVEERLRSGDGWYAKKGPSATPYTQLAVIRRRQGDTPGEIEILERYEAATAGRTDVGSSGKALLKRLEVRRSGRT